MTAPLHEPRPGTPDTQQGMRRRNLSRVMHAVATDGPLSRATVAQHIGLTRAAVSTLVDELIRSGLIEELGPQRPGRVGRPGSALAVSRSGPAGIGAEVGVDHLAACAVDLSGEVRARAVRRVANRGRAPGPVLKELSVLVREVTARAEREGLRPAGLAVAVPGLVARGTRTVVRAPNLDWHDTDVSALLPTPADAPSVLPLSVDNEANFGALAELWLGENTPPTSCTSRPRSASAPLSSSTASCCAEPVDSRASWGTFRFARRARRAPAEGAAVWSSTRARRPCCGRRAWDPARTGWACSPSAPRQGTRMHGGRCAGPGPPWVSR